jgi:hypothetical protein
VDCDLVVAGANAQIAEMFRDTDNAVVLVDDESALQAGVR